MQGGNIRLSLACMGLKQKYILSVRNDPKKEYPNAIMQKLVRYWFDAADGVVFQTEDAKKFFCSSVQNKSSIIYNPVSNQFFRENVSKDTAGIVAFGRLVDQKNFAMLIKAYAMIADRIDDDLYIYGEGPLEKRLYEIINSTGLAGRIHLMGRTNNVPEVLKTAKVYALSSDFEGMPNALLEAVCMLVPVVSTDCPCGGPKEICSNECGLLSPVGDVESFANIFTKFSNSKQLREQLVKKCIERRNAFSNDSILKKWDAFLIKCVDARRISIMHLYVSKKAILQYLMLYVMLIFCQTHVYRLYIRPNLTVHVGLAILFLLIGIVNFGKKMKRPFWMCIFLLAAVFLVRFINGGVGIVFWVEMAVKILITYIAILIDPEQFLTRFVKIITFFAAISIVGWLQQIAGLNIMQNRYGK